MSRGEDQYKYSSLSVNFSFKVFFLLYDFAFQRDSSKCKLLFQGQTVFHGYSPTSSSAMKEKQSILPAYYAVMAIFSQ